MSAEASIKELAAQVKLTQTSSNTAAFPIEARYFFPIPARAAVCGFVMVKQDGTRVVGTVLEKQEARETYNAAVAQGQQASLMEQQTPDVFQVSGIFPPMNRCRSSWFCAHSLPECLNFLRIANSLFEHRPERRSHRAHLKIGCPSYTVSTELGPDPKLPNFKELPFSNYARVSLSSQSALDKDFMLTIKAAGLDAPCCIAELHPTHETVALGLTLVPRFKLPDLSRQEFVFLVDRSGSMRGERIDAAKKALVVMLRALPHQGSFFQIVSFGDYPSFPWSGGSQPYNQQTLEEATRHVDGMRADYGGTQIWRALQECFEKRRLDWPMSVLVLTDRDAWDLDGVLNEMKSAVASAPATTYVRVSVLSIGTSASTAMCEGIARLGNGTCMMVGEEEETRVSFTGKEDRADAESGADAAYLEHLCGLGARPGEGSGTGRMTSRWFMVEEYTSEKPEKTLNIFDEAINDPMETNSTPAPPPPPVLLPPPAPVQQAPSRSRSRSSSLPQQGSASPSTFAILQGKIIRGPTAAGAEIANRAPSCGTRWHARAAQPARPRHRDPGRRGHEIAYSSTHTPLRCQWRWTLDPEPGVGLGTCRYRRGRPSGRRITRSGSPRPCRGRVVGRVVGGRAEAWRCSAGGIRTANANANGAEYRVRLPLLRLELLPVMLDRTNMELLAGRRPRCCCACSPATAANLIFPAGTSNRPNIRRIRDEDHAGLGGGSTACAAFDSVPSFYKAGGCRPAMGVPSSPVQAHGGAFGKPGGGGAGASDLSAG